MNVLVTVGSVVEVSQRIWPILLLLQPAVQVRHLALVSAIVHHHLLEYLQFVLQGGHFLAQAVNGDGLKLVGMQLCEGVIRHSFSKINGFLSPTEQMYRGSEIERRDRRICRLEENINTHNNLLQLHQYVHIKHCYTRGYQKVRRLMQ